MNNINLIKEYLRCGQQLSYGASNWIVRWVKAIVASRIVARNGWTADVNLTIEWTNECYQFYS